MTTLGKVVVGACVVGVISYAAYKVYKHYKDNEVLEIITDEELEKLDKERAEQVAEAMKYKTKEGSNQAQSLRSHNDFIIEDDEPTIDDLSMRYSEFKNNTIELAKYLDYEIPLRIDDMPQTDDCDKSPWATYTAQVTYTIDSFELNETVNQAMRYIYPFRPAEVFLSDAIYKMRQAYNMPQHVNDKTPIRLGEVMVYFAEMAEFQAGEIIDDTIRMFLTNAELMNDPGAIDFQAINTGAKSIFVSNPGDMNMIDLWSIYKEEI